MRFHRGCRRDAVRALLKKVSGAAERKHAEDANYARKGGRGGSDAGRAVATPGVR